MDGPSYTKKNEGLELHAYPDPLSPLAIAVREQTPPEGLSGDPWACGWGCTGPDIGPGTVWTLAIAEEHFQQRYSLASAQAQSDLGLFTWTRLSPIRQAALIDMAYQQGGAGLARFKHMLAAIRLSDWPTAHDECLNSAYAKEVPSRAKSNASLLLTGQWPTET